MPGASVSVTEQLLRLTAVARRRLHPLSWLLFHATPGPIVPQLEPFRGSPRGQNVPRIPSARPPTSARTGVLLHLLLRNIQRFSSLVHADGCPFRVLALPLERRVNQSQQRQRPVNTHARAHACAHTNLAPLMSSPPRSRHFDHKHLPRPVPLSYAPDNDRVFAQRPSVREPAQYLQERHLNRKRLRRRGGPTHNVGKVATADPKFLTRFTRTRASNHPKQKKYRPPTRQNKKKVHPPEHVTPASLFSHAEFRIAEARCVTDSLSWQVAHGLFRSVVKDVVAGVKQLDVRRLEVRR